MLTQQVDRTKMEAGTGFHGRFIWPGICDFSSFSAPDSRISLAGPQVFLVVWRSASLLLLPHCSWRFSPALLASVALGLALVAPPMPAPAAAQAPEAARHGARRAFASVPEAIAKLHEQALALQQEVMARVAVTCLRCITSGPRL